VEGHVRAPRRASRELGLKDESGVAELLHPPDGPVPIGGRPAADRLDEILEGGLAPGATVMSWRGTKGGVEAAHADTTS